MHTIILTVFTFVSALLGNVHHTAVTKQYTSGTHPSVVSSQTPTPTITITPTPTPQIISPSQKSLQVAAFLWIRLNSAQQAQIRSKYGGSTYTETITNWAIGMDRNPAVLAQDEAVMGYIRNQANAQSQSNNYYYVPTPTPEPATIPMNIQNKTCYTTGDFTRCSDGSSYNRIGNTTYVNGGGSGNNGTCTTIGGYTTCSDGSSSQQLGNESFVQGQGGSKTCTHIGNMINCN